MKFAKELERRMNPRFRDEYVKYKLLKKLLKSSRAAAPSAPSVDPATVSLPPHVDTNEGPTPPPHILAMSRTFLAELDAELRRMNVFVTTSQRGLIDEWHAIDSERKRAPHDADARRSRTARERTLWRQSSELREFVELNYTACYKAVKKHDKRTGMHLTEAVMEAVDEQPFMLVLGFAALDRRDSATGGTSTPRSTDGGDTASTAGQHVPPTPLQGAPGHALRGGHPTLDMPLTGPSLLAAVGYMDVAPLDLAAALGGLDADDSAPTSPAAVAASPTRSVKRASLQADVHAAAGGGSSVLLRGSQLSLPRAMTSHGSGQMPDRPASSVHASLGRSSQSATSLSSAGVEESVGLPLDDAPATSMPAALDDAWTASEIATLLRAQLAHVTTSATPVATPAAEASLADAVTSASHAPAAVDSGMNTMASPLVMQPEDTQLLDRLAAAAASSTGLPRVASHASPAGSRTPTHGMEQPLPVQLQATRGITSFNDAFMDADQLFEHAAGGGAPVHETSIDAHPPAGIQRLHVTAPLSPSAAFSGLEASLKQAHTGLEAALQLLTPELATNENDRQKRLARFNLSLLRCRDRVQQRVNNDAGDANLLKSSILAAKLEIFKLMLSVFTTEVELTRPEDAAAMEHVSSAHHALFAEYMPMNVRAPTRRRINLMEAMRARSMTTSVSSNLNDLPVAAGVSTASSGANLETQFRTAARTLRDKFKSMPDVLLSASSGTAVSRFMQSIGAGDARQGQHSSSMHHIHVLPQVTEEAPHDRSRSASRASDGYSHRDDHAHASSMDGARQLAASTRRRSSLGAAVRATRVESVESGEEARPAANGTSGATTRGSITVVIPDVSTPLVREVSAAVSESDADGPSSGSDGDTPRAAAVGESPAARAIGTHDASSSALSSACAYMNAQVPVWTRRLAVSLGFEEDAGDADAPPHPHKSVARLLYERWRPAMAEWLPEYKPQKHLLKDVIAGITIGIVLVPQGLAYATLAGLPPNFGIYTGLPGIVYACLGTSRQAAIGPMSIPALLIAAGVNALDPPPATLEQYVMEVMAVTFMVGVLLLMMGWLNLGFIVRFISRPVLSGFTTAASILTMVSVAKDLLGAPVKRAQVLQDYIVSIAQALPSTHLPTLITGVAALVLLLAFPKWKYTKSIPAPLLVVTIMIVTFVTYMTLAADDGGAGGKTGYATRSGIALVGFVPSDLPTLRMPDLRMTRSVDLMSTAVSVTFVGFIESIAVAKMYAVKHGYEISPSSELKALGCTNVFASVVQSFPVMAAFGRSAVNDSTGARSQLSGVIAAVTVAALLLFIMPALFYLPKAVLAAIIIVAVKGLIDVQSFKRLWHLDKRDCIIMTAALLATLFLGVLLGVLTAMLVSLVLFIAYATQPQVQELGRLSGTVVYRELGAVGVSKVAQVKILRFNAPLFFANCTVLKDRLLLEIAHRRSLPPRLKWRALILDCASVSNIDSTSIQVLEEVLQECRAQHVPLVLAGPNAFVERFIVKAGLLARLGGSRYVQRRVHDAVRAVLLHSIPDPAAAPAAASSPHAAPASVAAAPSMMSRARGVGAAVWGGMRSLIVPHAPWRALDEEPEPVHRHGAARAV